MFGHLSRPLPRLRAGDSADRRFSKTAGWFFNLSFKNRNILRRHVQNVSQILCPAHTLHIICVSSVTSQHLDLELDDMLFLTHVAAGLSLRSVLFLSGRAVFKARRPVCSQDGVSVPEQIRQLVEGKLDVEESADVFLQRLFERSDGLAALKKSTLNYLRYNRSQLPMFALPGLSEPACRHKH